MALPYDPIAEQAALQKELQRYQSADPREQLRLQMELANTNRGRQSVQNDAGYYEKQAPYAQNDIRRMLEQRLGDVGIQANIAREDQRIQDARNQLYGDAESLMKSSQVTPDEQMVAQMLRERISGQQLPMGEAQRAAYMANVGDNAAAGQQAAVANIRGNPNDPAYQAQVQAANRERLRRQQQARGQYDINAGVTNYNAQSAAANQLAAQQAAQFGRQAAATTYRGGLLAREESTTGDPNQIRPRNVPGWTPTQKPY